MSFSCILLNDVTVPCSYIEGNKFTSEHLMVGSIDENDLDMFLENGYRHFGYYFFRPQCRECSKCIPIRVPLEEFHFPRSAKRLFNKNKKFRCIFGRPHPNQEAYALYRLHKKRFAESQRETYDQFVESFFFPLSTNRQLSVYDDERLIAVAHMDVTARSLSAVYCYYDDSYREHSLGAFCIFKEIEYALEKRLRYLYLGYYIRENRHMNYKVKYRPNQLCVGEGEWRDYMRADKTIVEPELPRIGFSPSKRLITN